MSRPTASLIRDLPDAGLSERIGVVKQVQGPVVYAKVPDVRIGDLCLIDCDTSQLRAEVIGFDGPRVVLFTYGSTQGIPVAATVRPMGRSLTVPCGDEVLGRVINALGEPFDDLGPIAGGAQAPLMGQPPNPMRRARITKPPLETGVRAIDATLTLGRGQRMGIFAAAGGGKSTLLGMLARSVKVDRVVLALIGERGREVREFIDDSLQDGLSRSVVVVSTAEESALMRVRAAHAATAIAEAWRGRGMNVLLMMDSVTRFARALRDIGLAAGETPGRGGYTPSMYAELPRLTERAGNDADGSITAIYTVLVEGGDMKEPVAHEVTSLLDGHIILSDELAAEGHYPAIDIGESKSRLFSQITTQEHRRAAGQLRKVVANYRRNRKAISLGLYDPEGEEKRLYSLTGPALKFLRQDEHESCPLDQTLNELATKFGRKD